MEKIEISVKLIVMEIQREKTKRDNQYENREQTAVHKIRMICIILSSVIFEVFVFKFNLN